MKMTAGKKDEDYKDQKDQLEPFEKLKKNEEEVSEEPQEGFEEITHTLAKKFENPLCIDDLILEYDGRKVKSEGGIVKRALSFDITLDGEFYEEKLNMSEEVKLDDNTNGLVFNVEKLYGKCFNDISINFKYHVTKEASSYGKVNMKLSYKEGKTKPFQDDNKTEEEIDNERQAVITKLQELLKILEENPEGVTQEEVGSLTDAINDRDIQQVNLQINTIKNGLNSDENQIQQGLDLDTFKEAIERFNNI